MSDPRSPRDRILAEDDEIVPESIGADVAEQRALEAEANRQALMEQEEIEEETPQLGPTPEILTYIEVEQQVARLEEAIKHVDDAAPKVIAAEVDDALQGIVTILGMTFSGDVQLLVFRALQLYREAKGYR